MKERFTVTILGCGIMGTGIAHSANRAGIRTRAWDRTYERAKAVGEGVEAVEQLDAAVNDADIIVTMLSNAEAVLSVMDTQHGLASMKPGALWVQMSTIGLDGVERAQRLASSRTDIVFIDAPVSGTKAPAEAGKLMILASGDKERCGEKIEQFFEAIGQRTVWLGDAGQGTRMKIVMNAWLAFLMEGVAETIALADSLGVSPEHFAELIEGGPLAPAWALAKLRKIAAGKESDTEFPLQWATKDVYLALDASARSNGRTRLPGMEAIADAWYGAVKDGLGEYDLSAAYLALKRSSS
jgi:3-hydroxyisobutyrate dehydrogenase